MPEQKSGGWREGALLFSLALLLRLLFWRATPDAAWGWSAVFKGDAPVWLAYAQALQRGELFELGLPLRPPGVAYLLAFLWNGETSGLAWPRFAWLVMGALLAPLVYAATVRSFGLPVARTAGWITAVATGPLLLSSSLNNETPYLVVVLASFVLFEDARRREPPLLFWSALQALACLLRVEHALFALLAFPLLARTRRRVALGLGAFLLPLVPWHLSAWRALDRLNTMEPIRPPATEQAFRSVEGTLGGMSWTPDAARRREALPAFARRPASLFVGATVAWRGRSEVVEGDLEILDEAFGSLPEPLPRRPFVASYGSLNFALANHEGARGGFARGPLDAPPPLSGGSTRYPPYLVAGLPPPGLALEYPPHLELLIHGYRIGGEWIRSDPWAFARLVVRKLRRSWEGASLGLTGYNWPLGLSGTRRAVDLVTPDPGPLSAAWSVGVLVLVVAGAWRGRRSPPLQPWLLYVASKLAVAALFFGYARQGSLMLPALALFAALTLARFVPRTRRGLVLILALPLVLELSRLLAAPVIHIDGRPVETSDPWPGDLHHDQRIDVEVFS